MRKNLKINFGRSLHELLVYMYNYIQDRDDWAGVLDITGRVKAVVDTQVISQVILQVCIDSRSHL